MQKICSKCEIQKPLDDFYRDKSNRGNGRYGYCKSCKNKEIQKWRIKNREKYNADMRAYGKKYADKRRDTDLRRKYGVSLVEYQTIFASQKYVCAICEKSNTSKKRCFALDHCHKSGAVRGVLCYGCNRALHTLEKDGLLQKAQDYLKKFIS